MARKTFSNPEDNLFSYCAPKNQKFFFSKPIEKIDFFGTGSLVFSSPLESRSTSTKSPKDSSVIVELLEVYNDSILKESNSPSG